MKKSTLFLLTLAFAVQVAQAGNGDDKPSAAPKTSQQVALTTQEIEKAQNYVDNNEGALSEQLLSALSSYLYVTKLSPSLSYSSEENAAQVRSTTNLRRERRAKNAEKIKNLLKQIEEDK